jgi:cytochrome bd-type quinol oxidase subunit 2
MYQTLTFYHSITRRILLAGLITAIITAFNGYKRNRTYSATDNAIRHWTATIAHIQLVIGILLYSKSPVIKYFWSHFSQAISDLNTAFFALIHIIMMLSAIVLITIGAALAKRRQDDKSKFATQLLWFSIAFLIIIIAIPWPFSPLASRPYFR